VSDEAKYRGRFEVTVVDDLIVQLAAFDDETGEWLSYLQFPPRLARRIANDLLAAAAEVLS